MSTVVYTGEKPRFTISTYFSILSQAFQDKEDTGDEYKLSEAQKIERFKNGLKMHKAIETAIAATKELKSLPEDERTFQRFLQHFQC